MAFSYSPKIVTDGLVRYLDAGNTYSYVSGSTDWNDLSRSQISGSLINGPIFTGSNGGAIVFDGINDYVSIPTYTFGNGNWTVNMWVNTSASYTSTFGPLISNSSGGPVSLLLTINNNKINFRNYSGVWVDNTGSSTLNTNQWYMLTWVNYAGVVAQSGSGQVFVNGVSDSSIFNSYTTNGGPCDVIASYTNNTFYKGRIAATQIYTKSLSAQEVLQNFNAMKGRYGY